MLSEAQKERKRETARAWRAANRERHRAYTRQYRRDHAAECYQKNREWALANPDLVADYHRRSRVRNPGRNNAAASRWRKRNAEHKRCLTRQRRAKLRAANGTITPAEWRAVLEKYGPACLRCREIKPLTMDHIRAIDCGGSHTIDNVQPLCKECNSSKGTKEIDYRPK